MDRGIAGRRVPDGCVPVRMLEPGEYMYVPHLGFWYVRPPNGHLQHIRKDAEVVVHEDGSATISGPIDQGAQVWTLAAGVWVEIQKGE